MSWLINSTQPHIAHGYLLLNSAAAIWSAVSHTYSQVGNNAQVYELQNKVHGKKQGEYLKAHRILHQTCCVNTSSQNGASERKNRHLLEVAKSLIFTMNVPKPY